MHKLLIIGASVAVLTFTASTAVVQAAGPTAKGTADARAYTITTNSNQVTHLGPLYTGYSRNYSPKIKHAISAFGRPSSRFQSEGGCIVKWKRLGLRIDFRNYGDTRRGICHPDVGLAQTFSIENSRKWQTWTGLRIGMNEQQVWKLHPYAIWVDDHEYIDDSYWLHKHWIPWGDEGYYPTLHAIVNTNVEPGYGRIQRFHGWIGAAGE